MFTPMHAKLITCQNQRSLRKLWKAILYSLPFDDPFPFPCA